MPRANVVLISYGVNEPQRMTAGDVRAHLDAVQAMVRRRVGPDAVVWTGGPVEDCRVYWGSHGCCLVRGHAGDCICDCADDLCADSECPNGTPTCSCNVGAAPYYGPGTVFYGEDAAARGLATGTTTPGENCGPATVPPDGSATLS